MSQNILLATENSSNSVDPSKTVGGLFVEGIMEDIAC